MFEALSLWIALTHAILAGQRMLAIEADRSWTWLSLIFLTTLNRWPKS